MDGTLLLANASNITRSGEINLLGVGWRVTGPSPLPSYVVLLVVQNIPDARAGSVTVTMQLVDHLGEPVFLGDEGEAQRPVEIRAAMELPAERVGPEGIGRGINVAVDVGPGMLLEPGYYEWIAQLDGEPTEWRYRFYVRAKPDEFPPDMSGPTELRPVTELQPE